MLCSSLLTIFSVVSTLTIPGSLATPAPTPTSVPHEITIERVAYGGTGCPQGSVGGYISDDRTFMTLIFDGYVASIGPGVAVSENRKNCQLNIDLRYPGGFQYSIFSADYRGYGYLERGVTGIQKSTYYFSGQTSQVSTQVNFNGPFSGDYLKTDRADVVSFVWSPCGIMAPLNINSQVRLTSTNRSASGLLTTDSVDTKFTQIVYFQWQRCQ